MIMIISFVINKLRILTKEIKSKKEFILSVKYALNILYILHSSLFSSFED